MGLDSYEYMKIAQWATDQVKMQTQLNYVVADYVIAHLSEANSREALSKKRQSIKSVNKTRKKITKLETVKPKNSLSSMIHKIINLKKMLNS